MRIGMLTAGGDCPGLNAVIRAVDPLGDRPRRRGRRDHARLSGPRRARVHGSSTSAPCRHPAARRDDPADLELRAADRGAVDRVVAAIRARSPRCVSRSAASTRWRSRASSTRTQGLPLIGVPKTIDNDIVGTDFTFGFDTAVHVVSEAIDRLHTTAQSHDRVMVVEVMGRNAGWIALYGGHRRRRRRDRHPRGRRRPARSCAAAVTRRHDRGKDFSIVVVAEGANLAFADGEVRQIRINEETDEYGYERLGGIGQRPRRASSRS